MKQIPNDEIHVFLIKIQDYLNRIEEFTKILNEEEQSRAFRFRFQKDRDIFIVSHAMLRILLGRYFSIEPKLIVFGENKYGKPTIQYPKTDFHFNLSHSGAYALIAFSNDIVGIDIEAIDPDMSFDDVVDRFFSENERKEYEALPKNQRLLGFYQAWTRKEAYIKALGQGLVCSLKHFSVTLSPDQPAKIYEACDECAHCWHLYSFMPDKNYCAAIAWAGEDKKIIIQPF